MYTENIFPGCEYFYGSTYRSQKKFLDFMFPPWKNFVFLSWKKTKQLNICIFCKDFPHKTKSESLFWWCAIVYSPVYCHTRSVSRQAWFCSSESTERGREATAEEELLKTLKERQPSRRRHQDEQRRAHVMVSSTLQTCLFVKA